MSIHLVSSQSGSAAIASLSSSQQPGKGRKRKRGEEADLVAFLPNDVLAIVFHYLGQEMDRLSSLYNWSCIVAGAAVQNERVRQDAFGKEKWDYYLGDIGREPPLPSNFAQFLNSPCPYWSGKKIGNTHLLVLVVSAVDKRPLTLESLRELVKKPKQGHATVFRDFYPGKYKHARAEKNYWILMTKKVIPDSRNKTNLEQLALLKEPYRAPKLFEAATVVATHHIDTGERLFNDKPWTVTRCQEKMDSGYLLHIGGFTTDGIDVNISGAKGSSDGLAAVRELPVD